MKNINFWMGKFLLVSVMLSSVLIAIGGFLYLFHHHPEIVSFRTFHSEPKNLTVLPAMFRNAFLLDSRGLIQVGLLLLFITQILRVGATAWSFLAQKNKLFFGLSLFIFLVLMMSFFWSF